ncbi:EAL domain-containing protein [Sphingomonas quercus]|uniref:EAL domain-containing protein n=1 Tax=Sphingomonas quercus TaxID=2842451 RepID=A0ABS6BM92_9SPHN|nr:EAL domain-containing protein [Sphingomonas quercus]MBU3079433.1 EAL domain-containing protein [Sphingomonas quercus]
MSKYSLPSVRSRLGRALHGLAARMLHQEARERWHEAALHPSIPDAVLLADLIAAVENDRLALVYQPKLNARSNQIEAVEALLRWQHPVAGAIGPADFIPWAERHGLIRQVTQWVLRTAIRDQADLAASGHALAVSVNLSGRLVGDRSFTRWALEACKEAVGPIGMEITETAVIDGTENALENLHAYADAGIRVAIDDYGAGLSSLAYLRKLPASELKIDKMFISTLVSSHRDPLLVRSTIDLAHALEMEVTAEGVETPIALSLLRVMGCDLIQGYEISRPLPLDELRHFLDTRNAESGVTATTRSPVSITQFAGRL